MDLVSGYPYWLIREGLLYNYPALERSISTDVLIIGGGVSGALTAYQLVNAGIDCVVVDSRTIGLGSTCASTSLLQYEIDVSLSELIKKIGHKAAVTAYKLCEEAICKLGEIDSKINCHELEFKKSLYCAAGKKHLPFLEREFKARKENGFSVEFLGEEELKQEYGIIAQGAIRSATGAQTNAYKFTHALHQYCIGKGSRVYDRTCVREMDHKDEYVTAVTSTGHTIKAKKLVYANGYEAVNYVDEKIVRLRSTYAVVSEQLITAASPWQDEVLIWNTADPYLYVRTTKDNRIITGGRDDIFKNAHTSNRRIETKTKLLKKDMEALLQHIEFKPEFNWAGVFGSTKDGLPFIGSYPKKPNGYFALGFGGNGIVFSQVASEMLAEIFIKGHTRHGKLFSFERV
jgi:glycine/D-amino acid oxidase-like deaminating enzyme